jgi:hypothetical protein
MDTHLILFQKQVTETALLENFLRSHENHSPNREAVDLVVTRVEFIHSSLKFEVEGGEREREREN